MTIDADRLSEQDIWKILAIDRKAVTVEGYFLDVPEDDIVWFTNPYGVDGGMAAEDGIVCSFIRNIRKGRQYGPAPW